LIKKITVSVTKVTERTSHLLLNWLKETETTLDQLGDDPDKIKKNWEGLSAKKPLYDATMRDGKRLIDSSPKNDVVVLNKMLCEVEETWIRLSTKSVDRQRKLEEAHKSVYMLPDVNESFEETETLPIVEELIGEFSNPSSTGSPHTQSETEPLIEEPRSPRFIAANMNVDDGEEPGPSSTIPGPRVSELANFSNPSSTGSPHTQSETEPLIEPLTGLPSYGLASWPIDQSWTSPWMSRVPSPRSIAANKIVDDGEQPGPSSAIPRPTISELAGMMADKYVSVLFCFVFFYLIFFSQSGIYEGI
jgi:hypothetical protein